MGVREGSRAADDGGESIRALATVTLDARTLEGLGPRTLDRLAELVEARLMRRRAAGEEPLLSATAAGELVGVSADTIRRAIRSGAIEVAGYVGARPRVRRADVEAWLARGRRPAPLLSEARLAGPGFRPRPRRRVLGDALDELGERAA
jgi:excisionase family DNA binding protein